MLWRLSKDNETATVFDDDDGVIESVSIKDYNEFIKKGVK